jgi:hypothetical protein
MTEDLSGALEALLFVSDEPVSATRRRRSSTRHRRGRVDSRRTAEEYRAGARVPAAGSGWRLALYTHPLTTTSSKTTFVVGHASPVKPRWRRSRSCVPPARDSRRSQRGRWRELRGRDALWSRRVSSERQTRQD